MQASDVRSALAERIDWIEEAYDFLLAYAARGLRSEHGSQIGGQLRDQLDRSYTALGDLGGLLEQLIAAGGNAQDDPLRGLAEVIEDDARKARAAVGIVRHQPAISSALVDNLNASVHVRALLTDLFLLDEVLKQQPAPAA